MERSARPHRDPARADVVDVARRPLAPALGAWGIIGRLVGRRLLFAEAGPTVRLDQGEARA
jgi:hypothetical protein